MTFTRFVAGLSLSLALTLTAPAVGQEASADGERLFKSRCGSCHSLEPGQNRVGPSLDGIFGRAAGTVEGARYSKALLESGLVWDAQTLDGYLADPRKLVPGTTMPVSLRDADQRSAIIAFLRGQADPAE